MKDTKFNLVAFLLSFSILAKGVLSDKLQDQLALLNKGQNYLTESCLALAKKLPAPKKTKDGVEDDKREIMKELCNQKTGESVVSLPDFDAIAREFPKQFWLFVTEELKMLKDGKVLTFNSELMTAISALQSTKDNAAQLAKLAKDFKESKESTIQNFEKYFQISKLLAEMIKNLYENQEMKGKSKKTKIESFISGELKDFVRDFYGNEDDKTGPVFTIEIDQALQAYYLQKNFGLKTADFSKKIKNGKISESFTSFEDFYSLLIEKELTISQKVDLSNELIKAQYIEKVQDFLEKEILQIAQGDQTSENNVCSQDFLKKLIYLNALKKSTKGKFQKDNYLTRNISISINEDYKNEYCTEEVTVGKNTKREFHPYLNSLKTEWTKQVKVLTNKVQKKQILVSQDFGNSKEKIEESFFQLTNTVFISVNETEFGQSSDLPSVVQQTIMIPQERLRAEIISQEEPEKIVSNQDEEEGEAIQSQQVGQELRRLSLKRTNDNEQFEQSLKRIFLKNNGLESLTTNRYQLQTLQFYLFYNGSLRNRSQFIFKTNWSVWTRNNVEISQNQSPFVGSLRRWIRNCQKPYLSRAIIADHF